MVQLATSIKSQLTSENKDIIKQTLYVKEKLNISDKAYHKLSIVNPSLPHLSNLKREGDMEKSHEA